MLLRQLLMPLLAATVLADYAVLENWSEFCEFGFDCEIPGITCHGDVKIPISCEIACNETPECVGYEVMDFFCLLYSEVPSKGVAEDACHQNSRTFVKTFSDYTQLTDWNELCARGDGACDASGLTCSDQPSEDDCRASCDENEGCAAWSYFNDFCATASYYPEAINSELADCHSGATWFLKNSFQDPKSAFSQHNVNAFCELGSNCEAAGVHCFPDIASVYMCQEFAVEKEAGGYQIGQLDEKDICVVFNERPSSEAAECPEGRTYIRIPDPDEDFTQLAEWSEYCARGKAACENGATCSEQSHEPECRVQCLHDDSCRAWEYLSEMQLCVLFHYVPIKMPSDDSCHSESTVHVSVKQPQMDDMFVLTPEFSAFCLSFYDCGERGINCVDVSSSYDCRLLAGEENAQGYEISDGICVLFSFRPRLDPETTPSVCTTPDQETYINYRPTFPPAVPEPTTAPCDCKVISTCLFVNSNEQNLASKKARLISALDRASDIHKQCCVSFSLHTGVVHELNYSNISIGNGGLKLGDILLPDGTVPAKKVGDDTIIVNPATGKRVGNLEFSDILYAIQSQGKQLCPDVVTPRADACKRLRVFGFEDFANITKLGLGLRPGRAVIISFTQNTLGTTLAHEAGHNLGLRHTEEEPASAENADPNNVMHEESVSTGSPTRLSTYLSRATLSERQCTAERAKIEPLGLCHTTLAGRQCPNTTWDGIREDIRRLDEEHQRNLTAIDAAVAERSRQLNQNITDAKKKLEEVKEELKKAGAPNHHEYEKNKKATSKAPGRTACPREEDPWIGQRLR
eukprot:TRINITY_DN16765_c0_g1_i1.p1 TRINITY_DN16765_c0_g1~~TRINITY_DN16765_c0_g1_i1.p1  ORF type:complete len:826 (+),score=145.86 TRINITY_DN16765_c0_g1_i1:72-2480(+)